MKKRVFVVQPIPEVALDILRDVADVTVYPHLDRQISTDELVANAKRSDWLFVLGDTIAPAEVMNANPELNGIGALSRTGGNIDMAAAAARNCHAISKSRFGLSPTPMSGGTNMPRSNICCWRLPRIRTQLPCCARAASISTACAAKSCVRAPALAATPLHP